MSTQTSEISDAADLRQRLAAAVAAAAPCMLRWTAADDATAATRSARARSTTVDGDHFTAVLASRERPALAAAHERCRRLMVTMRFAGADLLFVARIREVVTVDAESVRVVIDLPDQLMETNRRASVRVEVGPEDADLATARAWRIEDRVPLRDRPLASREMNCAVRDLCAGGGRFALASKHRTMTSAVLVGDRLRIELRSGEHEMLFDARVRAVHAITPDGPWLCGTEFTSHAYSVESRRDAERLARVLAELQRRAFRRAAA